MSHATPGWTAADGVAEARSGGLYGGTAWLESRRGYNVRGSRNGVAAWERLGSRLPPPPLHKNSLGPDEVYLDSTPACPPPPEFPIRSRAIRNSALPPSPRGDLHTSVRSSLRCRRRFGSLREFCGRLDLPPARGTLSRLRLDLGDLVERGCPVIICALSALHPILRRPRRRPAPNLRASSAVSRNSYSLQLLTPLAPSCPRCSLPHREDDTPISPRARPSRPRPFCLAELLARRPEFTPSATHQHTASHHVVLSGTAVQRRPELWPAASPAKLRPAPGLPAAELRSSVSGEMAWLASNADAWIVLHNNNSSMATNRRPRRNLLTTPDMASRNSSTVVTNRCVCGSGAAAQRGNVWADA
jgi:hypothetical protein